MEIYVADYAGFCFGVKRAIELVEESIKNSNVPLYSLGPLIHNPQAVSALKQKGLYPIEQLQEINSGTLVIRSHGVSPSLLQEARQKGLKLIDATCPFVERTQKLAQKLRDEGYQVVIVGDEHHPEVAALAGWSGNGAEIVENVEEAKMLPAFEKIGVVAQTTQREENFKEVVEVLKGKSRDLVIHNTICHATRERQEAALELAKFVQVMIVVGGRNSSNTCKLAKVCEGSGAKTYQIEEAEEMSSRWFNNIDRVGVTAGASTPDWIIEEVVEKMTEFKDEQRPEEEVVELNAEQEDDSVGKEENLESEENANAESEESDENLNQEVEAHLAENLKNIRRGETITGRVIQIKEDEVLVDIGGKSEGIIPIYELSLEKIEDPNDVVSVGDEIEVQVLRVENEEGNPVLSKKRADREGSWKKLEEDYENGNVIEGKVVEVVKGGLLVDVGVRGFVPASLVERGYVEDLEQYLGQELRLRVIELDRNRNKVVLSQKAILDEEYEQKRGETWETLEEGEVKKGIVRRLTDFGAFVDLGGVDGLLHVSEITWGRVDHPSDVLSEGQEVEVKVLGINREEGKVSLGLKQLSSNPWQSAEERYPAGTIVEGKVLRIAPFGAFVEVEPGIEGLVHISQLAEEHVEKTEDVVSVGDTIKVKILSVDPEAQRMSLSLRQAEEKEEEKEQEKQPAEKEKSSKEKEWKSESKDAGEDEEDGGIKIGDLVGDIFNDDKKEDKED